MAKQGGLGDNFYLGGYNLSGDVNSLGRIGGGPQPWETTGIDKLAFERIGLHLDGALEFTVYFNDATGRAHPVLKTLPTASVVGCYHRGTTLGNPAAGLVAKQVNYDGDRSEDGGFLLNVAAQASDGYPLEWGRQLTAGVASLSGIGSGTSVDFATQTAFGAQAYLQVFSFTGTDATISIQASSDNGSGDAFAQPAGGLAFTQVTSAPFAQRITTAAGVTIERYARYNVATTGGFSALTFAIVLVKNETAVAYQ